MCIRDRVAADRGGRARVEFDAPSAPFLRRVFDASAHTHLSNLFGMQSDCPHRERFGYSGDALATLAFRHALRRGRPREARGRL